MHTYTYLEPTIEIKYVDLTFTISIFIHHGFIIIHSDSPSSLTLYFFQWWISVVIQNMIFGILKFTGNINISISNESPCFLKF